MGKGTSDGTDAGIGLNLPDLGELPDLDFDETPELDPEPKPPAVSDIFEEALEELKKKGLNVEMASPKEPLLEIHKDPASLGTNIFHYYSNALRHWDYVSSTFNELESRISVLKERLLNIKAKLQNDGLKPAEVRLDKRYEECVEKITKHKVQLDLLKPLRSSLIQRMRLYSRAANSVEVDEAQGRRAGNIGRPRIGRGDL